MRPLLIACALVVGLLLPVPAAQAQPATAPVIVDGWHAKIVNSRAPRVPKFRCQDRLASVLHSAGFTGHGLRMAWAIVMRESKGQNLDHTSPWFTGAYGIWQVQESAHRSKSWYSRSAMLNPAEQSRIVYRYMSDRGTYWRAWGLTPDGRLDTTHYRGWSSWQHEAWIMRPFRKYFAAYPC